MTENNQLSDGEMFKVIMDDIRYLRSRMVANDCDHKKIREELSKIREGNSGERVKMRGILTAVGLVVAGVIGWIATHLNK
jgi:hypothetical protein